MSLTEPVYSRDLLRLATRLADYPPIEGAKRIEARAPVCGSHMALDMILDSAGIVERIGLKVSACAFGQAAAALMAEAAIGKSAGDFSRAHETLDAYLHSESEDPGDWPGIAIFAAARPHSARHGAILMPFKAAAEAAKATANA